MKVDGWKEFACPMDGLPLVREGGSLRCEKAHTFDFAKEGYCNLLLVQQKGSPDPGDNKEMVAARKRFLDAGHFQPIAEKTFDFVLLLSMENQLQSGPGAHFRIVDSGCGEGYYLNRFAEYAQESSNSSRLELCGMDISKSAIKSASRRSKEISWVVAANNQPPFAKDGVDLILSMFGFPAWESFKKVQPAGGLVLLVDPAANHLIEMRKVIYPKVKETAPNSLKEAIQAGYAVEREESLQFTVKLESQEEIQDLLAMTPHAYRISAAGQAKLASLGQLELTVDLVFRLLRCPG